MASFVTSIAQESWEVGRAVVAFALGSVTGTSLRVIALCTPLVLVGTLMAFAWGRTLDVLLSGEEEAKTLGVAVSRSALAETPPTCSCPVNGPRPAMARSSVVLPAPLRPAMHSTSPWWAVKLTSRTMSRAPRRSVTPAAVTAASRAGLTRRAPCAAGAAGATRTRAPPRAP